MVANLPKVHGLGQQNCIQLPALKKNLQMLPWVYVVLVWLSHGFFGHTLWDSNGGVHVFFGSLMISYKNPITFLLGCQ